MTKTAKELADDIKQLSDQLANAETAEVTTGIWAGDSDRARAELYAAIDALLSLAQASQARTGGGAVASLIERLKAFRGPYLGDGVHTGIHRDELLAVLATPPGNATQAAGARDPLTKKQLRDVLQKTAEGIDSMNIVMTHWEIVARAIEAAHGIASPAAELK